MTTERKSGLHHIKVEVPDGEYVLTRVLLDGVELRGVTYLRFEVGGPTFATDDRRARVHLTLDAAVTLDGRIPADLVDIALAATWKDR